MINVTPKTIDDEDAFEVEVVRYPIRWREICKTKDEVRIAISMVQGMCKLSSLPPPTVNPEDLRL